MRALTSCALLCRGSAADAVVFDVVGVCLCVYTPAYAGAVPPRSAVAMATPRAARESPHHGEACWLLLCGPFKVVVGDEGCIATVGG